MKTKESGMGSAVKSELIDIIIAEFKPKAKGGMQKIRSIKMERISVFEKKEKRGKNEKDVFLFNCVHYNRYTRTNIE